MKSNLLGPCRSALVYAGFFSLFTNLLMLTVPLYMLQLFNRVLTSRSEDTLVMLSVVALGALVLLAILEVVQSRILVRVGAWASRALSPAVLARTVSQASLGRSAPDEQGLRDVATLRGFLSGQEVFHLFDTPWTPLYIGVIYLLHPWLGAVAAGGSVLLIIVALVNEIATRRPLDDASRISGQLFARTQASLRNAEAIDAMGMLPNLVSTWQRDNERLLERHSAASDRAGVLSALTRFIRLSLQIAVLAVGVHLALAGQITAGALIASSIILSRALAPVERLIGTWRGVVAARGAYHRLKTILGAPATARGTTRLPIPTGAVSVEHLTLTTPNGEHTILRDISFALSAGDCLGVMGASAAGKSSLARVLVGIWPPTKGSARLDGAEIFLWDRSDLGQYLGYLPQDVELFEGTVKLNIARMGSVDDSSVVAAARRAGAHEMILRLPMGYDTEIGSTGLKLSGGQRQRVGLARAFYGQPRLLVLDEPNASLDAEGERALRDVLAQVRREGITSVVVAHRLNTLEAVNKILVLQNGRIAHFGTREEVMARFLPAGRGRSDNAPVALMGRRPS